ncbi:nickel/cobalt efflux protein RcnA [Escherichia coli]|uniref:Nickel/cobalt efflux system n=1 Tax=Escherichia coli TaxID=562 RepID=A0A377D624_ECOLX|nr:nickel/cobalt efflux protein RcnA [Escherichia coli]
MTEFTTLLQQGNAWFFIPSAILLGALHGLEPGHSKTMMAAFIIAIKGTIKQAVMLGLAATISHTAVVWLIAFGGMVISKRFTAQSAEPWATADFSSDHYWHRVLDVLAYLARRTQLAGEYARA